MFFDLSGIIATLPVLIMAIFLIISIVKMVIRQVQNILKTASYTVSSDGHLVPPDQDLTCEKEYGHHHEHAVENTPRFIVHEDAEQGYVVLNGKKRKISDCKYL